MKNHLPSEYCFFTSVLFGKELPQAGEFLLPVLPVGLFFNGPLRVYESFGCLFDLRLNETTGK